MISSNDPTRFLQIAPIEGLHRQLNASQNHPEVKPGKVTGREKRGLIGREGGKR